MARPALSVTIIAKDEEAHIERAIRSVSWADEVLVVDSGSRDATVAIARRLGARVIERGWPGYGQQKNFAQSQAAHDWVLNLDADEAVPPALAAALEGALAHAARKGTRGFRLPRRTYYLGRWIRHGGWYPNHLVRLADRRHAAWTEPSVHEELKVDGPVSTLVEPLDHYAFGSIEEQVLTNVGYARLGTQALRDRGRRPGAALLALKPIGKFAETYFIKGGFRDGLAGFIISVNAAYSIFLKYAYLLEDRVRVPPEQQ